MENRFGWLVGLVVGLLGRDCSLFCADCGGNRLVWEIGQGRGWKWVTGGLGEMRQPGRGAGLFTPFVAKISDGVAKIKGGDGGKRYFW